VHRQYYSIMQTLTYIEDLLSLLYRKTVNYEAVVHHQDIGPIVNFNRTIDSGKLLTRKQGSFILQLLKKYRSTLEVVEIDAALKNPLWKNDFRVIDTTKYVYLETDDANITWLHIKFPYSFKDQFVKEFFNGERDLTKWDPTSQSRTVRLTEVNLVMFVEAAVKHGFEVDELVFDSLAYVEELWNNEDNLVPYSMIEHNQVVLKNANENAQTYWNDHQTGVVSQDLLLAKQMGFLLKNGNNFTVSERISSVSSTSFWFADPKGFFEYIDELQTSPVVIILDRTPEPTEWTQEFIENFPLNNFSKEDVRVCFRPPNTTTEGQSFNTWLKEHNLNKPVADGKIFLCQLKPPKWMFEKEFNIQIIASNSIYPSVNGITSSLIGSHPTVLYFDKVKPSSKRNSKIAEL